MRILWKIACFCLAVGVVMYPKQSISQDHVVYSIYKGVDLGNPGEVNPKDFYLTAGSAQGLRPGSVVEVHRKISSYDLRTEKLYKDVTFPIAVLKIIHAETNASVARMDHMMAIDKTPVITPRAVMVGDYIVPKR